MERIENRWAVLALAWWTVFVMLFAWQSYAPIILLVVDELGGGFGMAGLMVTASMITATFIQFPAGMVADRFGAVRPLLISVPPLVIATIWTGLAGGYTDLFFARVMIGLGPASFVFSMRSVTERFPAYQMGLAMGTLGAAVQAGAAFGPLVMPWLAEHFGWRGASMSVAALFIPAIAGWWFVRALPGGGPRLRWPADVLGDGRAWLLAVANIATFGVFLAAVSWLPTHFSRSYQLPLTSAGLLVAACLLIGAVSRPIGGALADRYGKVPTLFAGLCAESAGLAFTAFAPSLAVGVAGAGIFAFFAGLSSGPLMALMPLLYGRRAGVLIGFTGSVSTGTAIILPPVVGLLIDLTGSSFPGFMVLSAVCLGCALTTLALRSAERMTSLPAPKPDTVASR